MSFKALIIKPGLKLKFFDFLDTKSLLNMQNVSKACRLTSQELNELRRKNYLEKIKCILSPDNINKNLNAICFEYKKMMEMTV